MTTYNAHPYFTAAKCRELDRLAIEEGDIDSFLLMQRAAAAVFTVLCNQWPGTKRVIVFCGTGNNGGDGFLVAALVFKAGLNVEVVLAGDETSIKGDARKAMLVAQSAGVSFRSALGYGAIQGDTQACVLVDALLGTGLTGDVRGSTPALIRCINASGLPVLAVDIPSGICSDTGKILGCAVCADATVTFIGRKVGLVREAGPHHCGQLYFDDLRVPEWIFQQVLPDLVE